MVNRRATRVNFFSGGEILKGDMSEEVIVADISLNGVLLTVPQSEIDWQIGDHAGVTVRLNDSGLEMAFGGRVARTDGTFVGVEFEDMDLDTATHLRRLIELNTGEPAMVERPMGALGQ
jgi:hypothetical protein